MDKIKAVAARFFEKHTEIRMFPTLKYPQGTPVSEYDKKVAKNV